MVKLCLLTGLALFVSCSQLPRERSVATATALPRQWEAFPLSAQWGAPCAKPRPVGREVWTFCDGVGSVHGTLRRYDPASGIRTELVVPSREPLALAVSVSAQTSWAVGPDGVWAGTQDGRVLKFNFAGAVVRSLELDLHAWVKDLVLLEEGVLAVRALHQRVALVHVSSDLQVARTVALPEAQYQAELAVAGTRVVVASDRGVLREFSPQLELVGAWPLAPGRELGAPLVTAQTIWVGDEHGVLHRIDQGQSPAKAQLGSGPISSAPVAVPLGVWVASDDEGRLRLVDAALQVKKVVAIPFQRSLLQVRPQVFAEHVLIEVTSAGLVSLVDAEGELLLSQESPGEFGWELRPQDPTETLMSERLPASVAN